MFHKIGSGSYLDIGYKGPKPNPELAIVHSYVTNLAMTFYVIGKTELNQFLMVEISKLVKKCSGTCKIGDSFQ